jgi:hypothetical protein
VTDHQNLLRVTASYLNASNASWALVGGLAVSARTEPRFTQDIELAVSVSSDAEAELLVGELARRGLRVASTIEQSATDRLAIASVVPVEQADESLVELLFAMSGIEPEVVAGATKLEVLPGVEAPVAGIGHLIALKVLSRDDDTRPQDLIDLRALIVHAADEDIKIARESLGLIRDRGYHRGKNLVADLDELIQRFRKDRQAL